MAIYLDFPTVAPSSPSRMEQAERAVWEAKRAIGTLTRLASDAEDTEEALTLYHLIRDEVESSSTAAAIVALTRADERCGK
jgi:hypothetical protein